MELTLNPIHDGDCFVCDGATLVPHHTPGHCDDHMSLELKEENAILSGDCILGEGSSVFDDLYLLKVSLQKLIGLQNNSMYPGHGPKEKNAMSKMQGWEPLGKIRFVI